MCAKVHLLAGTAFTTHVQLGELFQEPMAAGQFAPGLPEVPETPENAEARAKYQCRRKDLGSTMVLGETGTPPTERVFSPEQPDGAGNGTHSHNPIETPKRETEVSASSKPVNLAPYSSPTPVEPVPDKSTAETPPTSTSKPDKSPVETLPSAKTKQAPDLYADGTYWKYLD